MAITLECPVCGVGLFDPDENGLFYEDERKTCPTCGTICWIAVDESLEVDVGDEVVGQAWVNTAEDVEDIGQTRCDRSCGSLREFIGTPCRWDCKRRHKQLDQQLTLFTSLIASKDATCRR